MFITDKQSNYDLVLEDLLLMAHQTGAFRNANRLGGTGDADQASVPVFGIPRDVRLDGVYQDGRRLDIIGSILTVRYLLQSGDHKITNLWLPYRDLKDGAQFSSYIKIHIEDRIAESFAGKTSLLRTRFDALKATPWSGEIQADLSVVVHPLPRVPVLCLFTDRDEEFPASFQFFFDSSASSYLDLEALAAALEYIYMKITEET
jgi:hypothetical protein